MPLKVSNRATPLPWHQQPPSEPTRGAGSCMPPWIGHALLGGLGKVARVRMCECIRVCSCVYAVRQHNDGYHPGIDGSRPACVCQAAAAVQLCSSAVDPIVGQMTEQNQSSHRLPSLTPISSSGSELPSPTLLPFTSPAHPPCSPALSSAQRPTGSPPTPRSRPLDQNLPCDGAAP
jgi:hypothetical protein